MPFRTNRTYEFSPRPSDKTQWDWLETPDLPESGRWGRTAYLLVGSLAHSGEWRAALSPVSGSAPSVAAFDRVTRELGGVSRVWRIDRMATVCDAATGRLSATFARWISTTASRWRSARPGALPQGRGQGQSHRRATLVAHPGRRADRRGVPARSGPRRRAARRNPHPGHHRRAIHRLHRRRQRAAPPDARAGVSGDRVRDSHRLHAMRWCPTAATATRCHRNRPPPR